MGSGYRVQSLVTAALIAFAGIGLGGLAGRAAGAAELEKKHVVIAVGGVTSQMDKLPYAVAIHKGFFKDEGLDVESVDFQSGAKGLEAMVGGSADLTQGAYEHTVDMQPKGIELTSIVMFSRYSGDVLGITKSHIDTIKTVADLKGQTIGISSPGSATHIYLALLLKQAGLGLDCCSYIAVGNGPSAVAAARGGEIAAIVNLDPNISVMEAAGDIKVIGDARTAEGSRQAYGGDYLVGSLYGKSSFPKQYPNTAQALANGVIHAMRWVGSASLDQIVDAMPPAYYQNNRALYRTVVEKNLPAFLWDGMATPEAAETVLRAISIFQPELAHAKIDLARTYTNEFTIRANAKFH